MLRHCVRSSSFVACGIIGPASQAQQRQRDLALVVVSVHFLTLRMRCAVMTDCSGMLDSIAEIVKKNKKKNVV